MKIKKRYTTVALFKYIVFLILQLFIKAVKYINLKLHIYRVRKISVNFYLVDNVCYAIPA